MDEGAGERDTDMRNAGLMLGFSTQHATVSCGKETFPRSVPA